MKPNPAQVNPTGSSGCSTFTPPFNAPSLIVGPGALGAYTLPASGAVAADAGENIVYVAIPGPAPGPAILKIDLDAVSVTAFCDAARFAAFDPAISALTGIALLDHDTLFVVDSSTNRILSVTASAMSSYAGISSSLGGYADGSLGSCLFRFSSPVQIAVGGDGTVFVPDPGNHRIRQITGGVVTTLAGSGIPGYLDATGTSARFDTPDCIAIECSGNLVITEAGNRVRRIQFKVNQSTFGGNQTIAVVGTLAGDGNPNSVDGTGGASGTAEVFAPCAVNVGKDGAIYWLDRGTGYIRRIDSSSGSDVVTTPFGAPVVPPFTSFGLVGAFAEGIFVDSVNNQLSKF